jgi:hypothetical protein
VVRDYEIGDYEIGDCEVRDFTPLSILVVVELGFSRF